MRSFNILYVGGAVVARSLDRAAIVDAFSSRAQLAVAEHARNELFVHAGVVEWNGRAILIPGRTFTGKSTLTLAFLQAGARYYSDEYAIIDKRGRVHPFPRPISIRGPGVREREAFAPATRAIPVGWILLTAFRGGAKWRPRAITPGQAVLALLANTVSARRRPGGALRVLHRAVEHVVALKGVRGEAEETVAAFIRACQNTISAKEK
ncbi:MAG TPA: hypothetical protein VF219_23395 [Vicinamibacterales bacterium]